MTAKINIGVFVPNGAQLLDLATVDVLGVMSKEYLSTIPVLPKAMVDSAPSVSISYITTPTLAAEASVPLTSHMVLRPSHSYEDAAVAPGQLDIVVVPGPDPASQFEAGALAWLRAHSEAAGVDVLCVCTGIYVCAAAGIANGRQVSGPRGLQDDIRGRFPEVRLVGDDHRWVRDGNFWSSGGITNGNDLMAAYARTSDRWSNKGLVEIALKLTDVGERGQFYGEGKRVFMLGFGWQLLRAWLGGGQPAPAKKA